MEIKAKVQPSTLSSSSHFWLHSRPPYLKTTKKFGLAITVLLLGSFLLTGCLGLHSTQKAEYDPARDQKIVQMTGNFLLSNNDDPGTFALNARKETPKDADPNYFLVLELTSVERNQLKIAPDSELVLRLDGEEKKLSQEGSGNALGNLRSAVFFRTDPDLLRKLGAAREAEVTFANNGKVWERSLTTENIENFRLFCDVNLPREKVVPQ